MLRYCVARHCGEHTLNRWGVTIVRSNVGYEVAIKVPVLFSRKVVYFYFSTGYEYPMLKPFRVFDIVISDPYVEKRAYSGA